MTTTETKQYQQLIGGQRVGAAGGDTFEDNDPVTGETVSLCRPAVLRMPGPLSPPPVMRFPVGRRRRRGSGRVSTADCRVQEAVADWGAGSPGRIGGGFLLPADDHCRCSRRDRAGRCLKVGRLHNRQETHLSPSTLDGGGVGHRRIGQIGSPCLGCHEG